MAFDIVRILLGIVISMQLLIEPPEELMVAEAVRVAFLRQAIVVTAESWQHAILELVDHCQYVDREQVVQQSTFRGEMRKTVASREC